VRSRACFPLSGSRRSKRSRISGVWGIGFLPLPRFELEAADVDPPLSIPELSASLLLSPVSLPCCRRGANLFWCSTLLRLSGSVPPRALMGTFGGSGMPKRRWVTTGGSGTPVDVVPANAAASAVPHVCACAPLPLGGISVFAG